MPYAPPHTDSTPIEKPNNAGLHSRKPHNRLRAVMSHTTRYAFKGETRLAEDAGVSKSALNRLINGQSSPSFALVCALAAALSIHLNRRIEPCELVSCDGTYPTRYVCALCGCNGCLPGEAYDDEGILRSEYAHIKPGQWSTEDFPALGESEVE
ncbi:MAG TPA: helix-turn-helix transcriptional regulator [Abditibacteriaceae bacterium]|jgi:transcriptional regulator with XRE-family HTH domain